ncbi:MAG: PAS-domain containing protein [Azospirillaceae bacterium]
MPLTREQKVELESAMPRAVYLLAADGRRALVAASPEAEALLGLTAEAWMARPDALRARLDAEARARYEADLDALEPGRTSVVEYALADAEGWPRILQERRRALPGPDGRVARYGCWVIDVTEARRAEAERTETLDRLRDAVDAMPTGFGVYDRDEILVACNKAFADLYGETPETLVGRTAEAIHRHALAMVRRIDGQTVEDRDAWLARVLGRMRATGQATEFELVDGRFLLVQSHHTADGGTVFIRTDITEQKDAERRVAESERQFRAVVEGQPLPVWMTDIESGEVIYASPPAYALFRIDPTVTPVLDVRDYWADPAERPAFVAAVEAGDGVTGWETTGLRADGTTVPVSLTARVVEHEGRRRLVTTLTDLTEREAREAAMREARETLEDAIESINEGFALYDATDRLVICNRRYRESAAPIADILEPGTPWETILRTGVERGLYVLDGADPESWVADRLATRLLDVFDTEVQNTNGRWFKISRQRTRTGGLAVIRTDITALKEMEAAVRQSEARFRGIADAHPVPVVIVGEADMKIHYASPATERLWGLARDAIMGRDIRDFWVDGEAHRRGRALFAAQGRLDNHEVLQRRADGTELPVAITCRPIVYDGQPAIVTGIFDLTEQRAAEAEIAKQRDALHQSEKLNALGALLAGISHELNNPLSVVVGQALLLQETTGDPQIAERAKRIGRAADRCSRIVRTFLAMARQQSDTRTIVQLRDVVESALDLTGYMLRSASIDVQVDLPPDLPAVLVDRDQIGQVVMNLVVNAQQALVEVPEPRRLVIAGKTGRGRGTVSLSVADNGPGLPEAIRGRIFEPFFTTKPVGSGTGVGLAISRGLVEAHGGRIAVEEAPGGGARFMVTLPAASAGAAAGDGADRDAGCRSCRVLAVDDEPDILTLIRDVLEADGHRVTTCGSGRAALEAVGAGAVDLILSDLHMPDGDGPSLYRQLAGDGRLPRGGIAFLTGDTLGRQARGFLEETGLPCLEKPFTPQELRDLVQRMTRGVAEDVT